MTTHLTPFVPHATALEGCELCRSAGGAIVWADDRWRVVRVADADFPAFYRVISQAHVAELSQLPAVDRDCCMRCVCAVEEVLIQRLSPTKVNLAALGNVVPHLHWHVVARFDWDSHFPQPIWAGRLRDVSPPAAQRLQCELGVLDAAVAAALEAAR